MRVDFYQMGGRYTDLLMVTCALVGKAWPSTQDIAIVGEADQLSALDEALWAMPKGRFIPHAQSPESAPVTLTREAPAKADLLINLNALGPLPTGQYQRVLEIVPPGDEAKAPLRQRWLDWKAKGATLNHHALK